MTLKTRYRRSESDLILVTPEEIWSYCIPITSDVVHYDRNWDSTNSGIKKGRNILHCGTLEHSQTKKNIKKVHKVKSYIKQKGCKYNTQLLEKLMSDPSSGTFSQCEKRHSY